MKGNILTVYFTILGLENKVVNNGYSQQVHCALYST